MPCSQAGGGPGKPLAEHSFRHRVGPLGFGRRPNPKEAQVLRRNLRPGGFLAAGDLLPSLSPSRFLRLQLVTNFKDNIGKCADIPQGLDLIFQGM